MLGAARSRKPPMTAWRPALAAAAAGAAIVLRSAQRSPAYWTLVAALLAVGVGTFSFYAGLHNRGAAVLPIADILAPRFLLATHGTALLTLAFFASTAFVGVLGGREARLGLAEAVGAKGHDNLPFLLGRVFALTVLTWSPVAAVAVGAQAFAAASATGAAGGALAAYALADALPAALLWCAMLSVIAARRYGSWLAPAVGAALLAAYHWTLSTAPAQLLPALSFNSVHGAFAQSVPAELVWPRRAATLAAAFGAVCVAAALLRRADDHRRILAGIGCAFVLAGVAGVAGVLWSAGADAQRRALWLDAQRAVSAPRAFGIEHLQAHVELRPATGLVAQLRVRLAPTNGRWPRTAQLSLNPALAIEGLTLDGVPAAYTHHHGLLTIALPAEAAPAAPITLALRYSGVPDPAFGYLDSGVEWRRAPHGPWAFLGREASIFTPRFIALMPAVRWLPAVGANVVADRPPDYFTLDLAVSAPDHWRIAGPGGLAVATGGGFRFQPAAPVAAVGLLAAPFAEWTGRASGVPVSFLFDAGASDPSATDLAQFAEALAGDAATLLADAARLGLPYPFEGLTFAAVPPQLRVYAGGWRMGVVNTLPGVVLLRGSCFAAKRRADVDDSQRRAAWKSCLRWNDTGASPPAALVRHAFAALASARGEGALAVDMLVDALARRLLAPGVRDFSANDLPRATTLRALTVAIAEQAVGAQWMEPAAVTAPEEAPAALWRATREVRLSEVSAASGAPAALAALRHKVDAAASLVWHVLGRRRTAAVLADLRAAFAADAFPPPALFDRVAADDADLARYLRHWLRERSLPGFLASDADVLRLPDDGRGRARWQTTIHVRNGEAAPGYVRLQVGGAVGRGFSVWNASDPVFVPGRSAVEVGVVGRIDPTRLVVDSYLSLNQGPVHVDVAHGLTRAPAQRAAFDGARPSQWREARPAELVVDDLDVGFRVLPTSRATAAGVPAAAVFASAPNPPLLAHRPPTDAMTFSLWRGSLPAMARWLADGAAGFRALVGSDSGGWTRQPSAAAWGRYRRTIARAPAGNGDAKVAFVAELPHSGQWRLDYHLPDTAANPPVAASGAAAFRLVLPDDVRQGGYDIAVLTEREARRAMFDGALALPGWNTLGDFDLPAGEVAVVVSNASSGGVVFADAVRWRPAAPRIVPVHR